MQSAQIRKEDFLSRLSPLVSRYLSPRTHRHLKRKEDSEPNSGSNTPFEPKYFSPAIQKKADVKPDDPSVRAFIVQKKNRFGGQHIHKRALMVDLSRLKIFCRKKNRHGDKTLERHVLKMEKCLRNNTRLVIQWKNARDAATKKTSALEFKSSEQREQFYECVRFVQMQIRRRFRPRSVSDESAENLSVFVGTWNMGDSVPSNLNWIPRDRYDIYAVGVQECSVLESAWFELIQHHLGPDYTVIHGESLWQIRILVLARKKLEPFITNVECHAKATGVAHIARNKGAIGVSFAYKETLLCFVNAHLAAHQEKVENRNAMYSEIVKSFGTLSGTNFLNEFDHIFWCGDLNYRLELTATVIERVLASQDWGYLQSHDQLRAAQKDNKAFVGFREGTANFPPTFKLTPGDKEKYCAKRLPAYCDRILWKSLEHEQDNIVQTSLDCWTEPTMSDHAPVFATFEVRIEQEYSPDPLHPTKHSRVVASDLELCLEQSSSPEYHGRQLILQFHSRFSDDAPEARLPCCSHSNSPKPSIELDTFMNKGEYLDHHHIYVDLYDRQRNRKFGEGVLPLNGIRSGEKEFEISINNAMSVCVAKLSGVLQLSGPAG
eukprot:TRINITY_DN8746_c0_g1_i1.p1 TRINITY_DN8746_c0_g1~~TRINITY_DN8746_c0_g1_i1.p1  ORF type:complete len:604 (+),score=114.37 TRINITY_DN8746_c0_g1_i1:278-2089(+)